MGYNKIDDYIEAYDRIVLALKAVIPVNLKASFIILGNLAEIMDIVTTGKNHKDTFIDYENNRNIYIVTDMVSEDNVPETYEYPEAIWCDNKTVTYAINYLHVKDINSIPVDGVTKDGYKYNCINNIIGLFTRLYTVKVDYQKKFEKIGDCFYKLNMEEFPELNKAIEQSKYNLRFDCVKDLKYIAENYLGFNMVDQIELKYYVP